MAKCMIERFSTSGVGARAAGIQRTDAASKKQMLNGCFGMQSALGSKYHWAVRNTVLLKDEIARAAGI